MTRLRVALAAILTTAAVLASAPPAAAAPITRTVNGIVFTADDSNVSAGATVTDYVGGGGPLTIPSIVVIGMETYTVRAIADQAFDGGGLTGSLSFPPTIRTIGAAAFRDNSLTAVTFPGGISSVAPSAFESNDLTSLTLTFGVNAIGDSAFADNDLTTVRIPNSVRTIGSGAFRANQLSSQTIPDSVETIATSAFADNDLTEVEIGTGVSAVGASAFAGNPLANVRFFGDAPTSGSGSFGADSPTARHRVQFAGTDPDTSFTSPTWRGLPTQAYGLVTFDAAGGTPAPARQLVDVGDTVTEPTDPDLGGSSVFLGWFAGSSATAPYDFTATVTGDLTLTARYGTAPDISGTAPAATVGQAYTFTPTVTGDPAPTFSLMGDLPDGLSLNETTGVISGTPLDAPGTYEVTLDASNTAGSDQLEVSIVLGAGLPVDLTMTASDLTPDQGDTVTFTVTAQDEAGNDLGDQSANVTLTSDVPTDVVVGNTVRFPTASPHTITATHVEIGSTTTLLLQVTPSAGSGNGLLPDTGSELALWTLAVALMMTTVGAVTVRRSRRAVTVESKR